MLALIAGPNVPKSKDRVNFVVQGSVAEMVIQIQAMDVTDHLELMEKATYVLLKVIYCTV